MGGIPGMWGYVTGGMGLVSFIMCDAAQEAGAVVAAGCPVSRIIPGQGVQLESGERLNARVVVSNADPMVTLQLLDGSADTAWRQQVESVPMTGCTVKITVALKELPNFLARPGRMEPHHFGQVNTPLSKAEWLKQHQTALSGELPERLWTELYFQSSHDPSVAPPGRHTMSVFAQPVPYDFAHGDWDSRRDEVAQVARLDRSVYQQHSWGSAPHGGDGTTRHRAQNRTDRRAHLPGRVPARIHVGQEAHA
jgi:phytoene dehydrogenase-like protein